jgi:CubicO group peptidase (beta-lactamase class C family)
VVIRRGGIAAEWNQGLPPTQRIRMRSATKSVFATLVGIALAEGVLKSVDQRLVELFPEALDVPPGTGPKPGQYAMPKDRAITLRQLLSHTSGYLKPDEEPGRVFHYQTYAMVAVAHVLARAYGLHRDDQYPDLSSLIESRLARPIGANWGYYQDGFEFPPPARTWIFARLQYVEATALDMARLGWLWRQGGTWHDRQLVPRAWLSEATKTAAEILRNCEPADRRYGYGFWTNDHHLMWPSLPLDSFAAWGAGSQHIWVCPSLDLVVVQSPGAWDDQRENDGGLLTRFVELCGAASAS